MGFNEFASKFRMVEDFLRTDQGDLSFLGIILAMVVLIIGVRVLVKIFDKVVKKAIIEREENKHTSNYRVITLTKLASSLVTYGLYAFGALIFLNLLNVNTSTILATAGVGTLALAMGAQTLVKDFIQGFFILFEDQYSVGEFIECAGVKGYVIEVGVRVTKIRSLDGILHIVPNSEIRIVTNSSRGLVRSKVFIYIDEKEDPNLVLKVLSRAMEELRDPNHPGNGPEIWGVTKNMARGYEITIVGYASFGKHYDFEYEIRQASIEAMRKEGISQPRVRIDKGE